MNLNPFTFFGLLDSRVEPEEPERPNGGSRTNGRVAPSGRATLLKAPEQATVDAVHSPEEEEADRLHKERREAAQAKLASTSTQVNGTLDELLAQQVREAEARGIDGKG